MRTLANALAPHSIRVNTVHPTAVNTMMAVNPAMTAFLEHYPDGGPHLQNPMPVSLLEPEDISAAVALPGLRRGQVRHRGHVPGRRRLLQQADERPGRGQTGTDHRRRAGHGPQPRGAAGRGGCRPDPGRHLRLSSRGRVPAVHARTISPKPPGWYDELGRRAVAHVVDVRDARGARRRRRRRRRRTRRPGRRRWPTPGC